MCAYWIRVNTWYLAIFQNVPKHEFKCLYKLYLQYYLGYCHHINSDDACHYNHLVCTILSWSMKNSPFCQEKPDKKIVQKEFYFGSGFGEPAVILSHYIKLNCSFGKIDLRYHSLLLSSNNFVWCAIDGEIKGLKTWFGRDGSCQKNTSITITY